MTLLACSCSWLGGLQCDSEIALRQGGYTFRWQGITFINSTKKVKWTVPYKQIFWDLDGSITGTPNGWITPYYHWNDWTGPCTHQGAAYDNGIVCDNTTAVRRLQIDQLQPYQLDQQVRVHALCEYRSLLRIERHRFVFPLALTLWLQYIILDSAAGSDRIPFLPLEIYGYVVPVVVERSYNFRFTSLIDWQSVRIRYSEPEYVQPTEWLQLSTNFTDYRLEYEVCGCGNQTCCWVTKGLRGVSG